MNNNEPITPAARTYIDCFLRWLRFPNAETFEARKFALRTMLGEAGVPFVRPRALAT